MRTRPAVCLCTFASALIFLVGLVDDSEARGRGGASRSGGFSGSGSFSRSGPAAGGGFSSPIALDRTILSAALADERDTFRPGRRAATAGLGAGPAATPADVRSIDIETTSTRGAAAADVRTVPRSGNSRVLRKESESQQSRQAQQQQAQQDRSNQQQQAQQDRSNQQQQAQQSRQTQQDQNREDWQQHGNQAREDRQDFYEDEIDGRLGRLVRWVTISMTISSPASSLGEPRPRSSMPHRRRRPSSTAFRRQAPS